MNLKWNLWGRVLFIYLFISFKQLFYVGFHCPQKRFKSTCAQYGCYSIYLCDYFGCMLVSSWPFIPTQSELPMSSQQGAMSAKSQIDRRDWILLPPPCKEVHPSLSTGKSSGWSWASTPTRLFPSIQLSALHPSTPTQSAFGTASFDAVEMMLRCPRLFSLSALRTANPRMSILLGRVARWRSSLISLPSVWHQAALMENRLKVPMCSRGWYAVAVRDADLLILNPTVLLPCVFHWFY